MLGLYTLGYRPSLLLQKNDLFESNTCQGTLKFTTLNFYDILNLIESIFCFLWLQFENDIPCDYKNTTGKVYQRENQPYMNSQPPLNFREFFLQLCLLRLSVLNDLEQFQIKEKRTKLLRSLYDIRATAGSSHLIFERLSKNNWRFCSIQSDFDKTISKRTEFYAFVNHNHPH